MNWLFGSKTNEITTEEYKCGMCAYAVWSCNFTLVKHFFDNDISPFGVVHTKNIPPLKFLNKTGYIACFINPHDSRSIKMMDLIYSYTFPEHKQLLLSKWVLALLINKDTPDDYFIDRVAIAMWMKNNGFDPIICPVNIEYHQMDPEIFDILGIKPLIPYEQQNSYCVVS